MAGQKMEVSIPKYQHLSRKLKSLIESGHYRSGQQIPTEHELVSQYNMSRNTVRQAISILEEENYLIRRPGAGTFVAGQESSAAGIKSARPLESIVLLVLEPGDYSDYALRQVAAAEKWASEHSIALAATSVDVQSMLRGHRPTILNPRHCQGVFLVGWVDDMHCMLLEAMEIPYLVVGNRPVSPRFPQYRLDTMGLVRRMIEYARSLTTDPDLPVALLVEPLEWHMSKEMLQAYTQIVHDLPQKLPLLEMVEYEKAGQGVERLLDVVGRPFALLTAGDDRTLPDVDAVYRSRGIDPAEYPVISLTHNFEVNNVRHLPFHLMPYGGDSVIIRALPEFVAAYERGMVGQINTSLCPDRIIAPTHGT